MLITGYFMCTSHITLRKFLKLFGQIYFWKILIYIVFLLFGIDHLTLKSLVKTLIPIAAVETNFTGCFILFWLFIPFLNKVIQNIDKKMHLRLLALTLFIYSFLYFLPGIHVSYNYVSWFIVLYFIASYLRLYPLKKDKDTRFWILSTFLTILASLSLSVAYMLLTHKGFLWSFLVDSNAPMAVLVSVCSFMWFKNIKIKQSKLINTIAATTFGVLLIHGNSNAMRQWLWKDTLQNTQWFQTDYFILHAVLSVIVVFCVCAFLDYLRIKLIERPLMNKYDSLIQRWSQRLETSKY